MTTSIEQGTLNKAEFYAKHIKDWQKSGMPQKKYCKSVNLSYPTFIYWRVKFRGKNKGSVSKEQPTFIPINSQLATTHHTPIVASSAYQPIGIILSNGTQLSFH